MGALDVPVEHRGVGVEAEFMGDAVDIEPDVGADLALVRLVVDAIVEDLGPAAGERAESGLFRRERTVRIASRVRRRPLRPAVAPL